MRRADTALLHGPWDDTEPDTDTLSLVALREEHAGRWVIWRAVNPQQQPGAWCARRTSGTRAPAGLTAASPEELRQMIEETDR